MCWRHRLFTVGLVFAIVFPFTAEEGWAQGMPSIPRPSMGGLGGQRRQQPQQQQQQLEQQIQALPSVQTTGSVEQVVPGWIQVLSTANQLWTFQVMPTAKCQVTGKAKADALCQGCFVRFIAPVTKRGVVDDPVAKLLVFTPSQFRQVGADPDTGFGSNFGERPGAEKTAKKADEKAKPAFGAAAEPAPAAEPDRGAGRKSGGRKKVAAPAEKYDVRGQVKRVGGGKLWLYVPNDHFRSEVVVEVAENADIDVELDDPMGYTVARKGDKIRVMGRQGITNKGFATDLDIMLSEPLGAGPASDTKKGHAKGRGKKGAEEEPAPAAGEKKGEKKDADADAPKKAKPKDDKDADNDAAPKKKAKTKDADKDADAADTSKADDKDKDADAEEPKPAKKPGKARPAAKKPAKDADAEETEK